MAITKEDLEKTIEELNDKIVDPPIEATTEEEMTSEILEASGLIDGDEGMSKESMDVIKTLKKEHLKKDKTKKAEVKKTTPKKDKPKKDKRGKTASKLKEKARPKVKVEKGKKLEKTETHMDCIIATIEKNCKKGVTVKEIKEKSLSLYTKGKSTNINNNMEVRATLLSLVHFNVLYVDEDKYIFS